VQFNHSESSKKIDLVVSMRLYIGPAHLATD
jgi:hypothetical protein